MNNEAILDLFGMENPEPKHNNKSIIKSISYEQKEIIYNILQLHCKDKVIELDPTFSSGEFYKDAPYSKPLKKYDLFPKTPDIIKATANDLPLDDNSICCMMFDPPFIVGHTKDKPTGKIGKRFHGFATIEEMWKWYHLCLKEFYRILKHKGILIFKCQDTVSRGKQFLSHVDILNKASDIGFYNKDLFVLLANSRMIGHNHHKQKHARKFHSYFLVLQKT